MNKKQVFVGDGMTHADDRQHRSILQRHRPSGDD